MDTPLPQGLATAMDGAAAHQDDLPPARDLVAVARYLVPTDAHVMRGCLAAAGIPAVVADDQHAQAHLLLVPALGGVRVLVPHSFVPQAQDVMAAFERGAYMLRDDLDPE